jgi:hypothetical protein
LELYASFRSVYARQSKLVIIETCTVFEKNGQADLRTKTPVTSNRANQSKPNDSELDSGSKNESESDDESKEKVDDESAAKLDDESKAKSLNVKSDHESKAKPDHESNAELVPKSPDLTEPKIIVSDIILLTFFLFFLMIGLLLRAPLEPEGSEEIEGFGWKS